MSNIKRENKLSISHFGNLFVFLSVFITLILWLLSKDEVLEIFNYPFLALNQISALLGVVLLAWSQILTSRIVLLELLFGGLDKVYKIHRKLSEIGFSLIALHLIFLLANRPSKALNYLLPFYNNQAVNFGVYSFWLFIILILITLFIRQLRIPYHLWKQSHKFLNLAMILALLHTALIKSDVSVYPLLGIWIKIWLTLGVASGLYKSILYKYIGPKYKYVIESIRSYNGVYDIWLKPANKKFTYNIAQFVYVAFDKVGFSRESHPFCLTSIPGESNIRLCIKELGDYTNKLHSLKKGDRANVWGPHGQLGKTFSSQNNSVFIAGGIGIAPFLSMFKKAGQIITDKKVGLFYCTSYKADAVFDKELINISKANKNLHYINQCSREKDGCRLSTQQVLKKVNDKKKTKFYLCGPKKMMRALSIELVKKGINRKNIFFEDFEMI